jgi:hypothetical protein
MRRTTQTVECAATTQKARGVDLFTHTEQLLGRLGGPLSFRFLIQPSIAAVIGIVNGVSDAKAGRPAYFLSIFTDARRRREHLLECWDAIWKVFLVAAVLDVIYEIRVFKLIYVGETVIVATALAVVPYVLVRGPANRLARFWLRPPHGNGDADVTR